MPGRRSGRPISRAAGLTQEYGAGCASYYYGFRNSDQDIVGVLELLVGRGYRKDVDSNEMFMEPVAYADDED